MKKFLVALAALLLPIESHSFFTDVQSQQLTHKSMLFNGGFENGKKGWTASAGSFSTVTSAANIGQGNESVSWDASATAQNLRSDLYTIPAGLYARSCLASIKYKGGDSGLKFQVLDGSSNVLATQTLSAQTNFATSELSFLCPSSGQLRLSIDSTADAAIAYFDNAYLGEDYRIGVVSQPQLMGRLSFAKTASCTWTDTDTSGALVDYATIAACPGPTVEYAGNGPHTWSTTDTDLPQVSVSNLPPGIYLVRVTLAAVASSGTLQLSISDGTTNSGTSAPQQISNTTAAQQVLSGYFSYSSGGNRTFKIQHSQGGVNQVAIANATAANVGNSPTQFEIIRYPSANDISFRPDQTPASWSGYHANDCQFPVSSGGAGFVDLNSTSCSAGELQNRNFGSVTSNGVAFTSAGASTRKAQIEFTPPRIGRYLITVNTLQYYNASPNATLLRMVDGSGGEIASASAFTGTAGGYAVPVTLSGILNVSSIASVTVKLQGATSAGTSGGVGPNTVTATNSRTIAWSVVELDAPLAMPFIMNSVRSSYSGVIGVEAASVTTNCAGAGACTITENTGGITSITRGGSAGVYTVAIAAGTFSSKPICICGVNDGNSYQCAVNQSTSTSTSIVLQGNTAAGVSQDIAPSIHCIGPR